MVRRKKCSLKQGKRSSRKCTLANSHLCHVLFSPPTNTIRSLNSMVYQVFWGGFWGNKKMRWKSWSNLCQPKHKAGWVSGILRVLIFLSLPNNVGTLLILHRLWWLNVSRLSTILFGVFPGCLTRS